MKIGGDALLLPQKYDGKVLLMGDNGEGAGAPPQGVRVFLSKDDWATVKYLGFVDTTREDGGFPTWGYEIQGSIYVSMMVRLPVLGFEKRWSTDYIPVFCGRCTARASLHETWKPRGIPTVRHHTESPRTCCKGALTKQIVMSLG